MNRINFTSLLVFFVCTLVWPLGNGNLEAETAQLAEADALLQSPSLDFQQAAKALTLYEKMLPQAGAQPIPLWIRLAKVNFILGDLAERSRRKDYYERGKSYAELLCLARPGGVEGHYWLALNLAGLADVSGARRGLQLVPSIIKELQRSLAIDETYDQAGAHRVLGRIYYEAPGWPLSVGDPKKSLRHLSAAVRLAPENSTNHLFLAEILIRLGRLEEARPELELAVKAPRHAMHPRGLNEDHREARHLLEEMAGKGFAGTAPVN